MDILVLLRLSVEQNEDELNPLIVANAIKKKVKHVNIDCVTMDRRDVIQKIDRCRDFPIRDIYILNDDQFAGADTFLTAYILKQFIQGRTYDIILGNYKSRFGETAHVPISIAAMLDIPYASNVYDLAVDKTVVCTQRLDFYNETIELKTPCAITCAGTLDDKLEFDGMLDMFQIEEWKPQVNILSADDIQFKKDDRINIFSRVVNAEKIEWKSRIRKEISNVDEAREFMAKTIGI